MKPYIEYNGQKFEFEASFSLKREYDKEIQSRYKKMIKNDEISENDLKEIQVIEAFIKENPNITEEKLNSFPEMKDKILKYEPLLNALILTDIYEKYCFKMLEIKYGIDKTMWEKMLEQYVDDYCDSVSELDNLFNKVIEKVFTQQVEKKTKKPLPEWM